MKIISLKGFYNNPDFVYDESVLEPFTSTIGIPNVKPFICTQTDSINEIYKFSEFICPI